VNRGTVVRVWLAVSLLVLVLPTVSSAQQDNAGKVWRIGWLSPPSPATGASELDALRDGLRALNYVEGRNLKVEAMWAEGDQAMLPRLARVLVERQVDVICTAGTPATLAAKHATATIPIVFGRAAFPDQTGLVASMARPGGNLTGVTFIGPEYGKRLELLREVAPRISRVTLLYNDQNTASVLAMNETQQWAKTLRVAVEPLGVHDRASLDAAFSAIRRGKSEALMTTADALLVSYRALIVKFAGDRRLISMYGDREYVKAGGLMFYGTSNADMWRHAAVYVDRILKGTKPGDLPVEQPTKFELIINMAAAKSLALTIPGAVRLRADEILE
jgi:putative ABC transport system substrate-binding protein